ncbi:hypothetical protein DFH29DRAFT_321262 [Suillus ampliporus]|nr:hypothetical protein DFH29DRAFT_321262 [Suillus ampliporus]
MILQDGPALENSSMAVRRYYVLVYSHYFASQDCEYQKLRCRPPGACHPPLTSISSPRVHERQRELSRVHGLSQANMINFDRTRMSDALTNHQSWSKSQIHAGRVILRCNCIAATYGTYLPLVADTVLITSFLSAVRISMSSTSFGTRPPTLEPWAGTWSASRNAIFQLVEKAVSIRRAACSKPTFPNRDNHTSKIHRTAHFRLQISHHIVVEVRKRYRPPFRVARLRTWIYMKGWPRYRRKPHAGPLSRALGNGCDFYFLLHPCGGWGMSSER